MINDVLKAIVIVVALCLPSQLGCDGKRDITQGASPAQAAPSLAADADGADAHEEGRGASGQNTPFPVHVQLPSNLGLVPSGVLNLEGEDIGVGCDTCHESHQAEPFAKRSEELTEWHLELTFAHGKQTCFSCHAPEDRTKLKLADGERLPFEDVQRLCAQCHGPQARDWRNGSHGGMRGYWDLTKGPRVRGSCVSCHAAHNPDWPQVMPVFKPRDRFLGGGEHP